MTILDPNPPRCELCDALYVVESLARWCELEHLRTGEGP